MARVRMGGLMVLAGTLALTGCGEDSGAGSPADTDKPPSVSKPTAPYHDAPFRLQVVNLLEAAATPKDHTYRNWLRDDPGFLNTFIYTPSSSDPAWKDRNSEGEVTAYPGKMSTAEKRSMFASLTRGGTIDPHSLKVAEVYSKPDGRTDVYDFTFKIATKGGKTVKGRARGGDGLDPKKGQISRITYASP
ncbi:hypothetical protein [Streptomyces sp. PU-14G]|uniref:hypothetical protein n=1 Tax=Streptomyces sp. PU-14G TaxID=2800808 RepID=UPI0034DF447F